jgi:hypothetical protein
MTEKPELGTLYVDENGKLKVLLSLATTPPTVVLVDYAWLRKHFPAQMQYDNH